MRHRGVACRGRRRRGKGLRLDDTGRTAPRRVLILRDHLRPSGGTTYFADVLPRLDPSRVAVRLVVLSARPGECAGMAARGIDVAAIRFGGRDPRRLRTLLHEVRSLDADLIHASGPKAMLAAGVLSRLTDRPATMFFNNALAEPWARRRLQRLVMPRSAAGVAASGAMRDWAVATYGIPRDRIEVIYGGRDLSTFLDRPDGCRAAARSRLRRDLGLPETAPVIGLVGRVDAAQKGHLGLIDTVAALLPAHPGLHLVVAGDGPDLDACRRRAAARGIAERVHLLGARDDVPDVLAAVDIVALPSLVADAFPFSALEALATERPVVAFRSGGLGEAVRDGETGRLVATGDWTGFAAACDALLRDPDAARRLGQAGPASVRPLSVEAHAAALTTFLVAHARPR